MAHGTKQRFELFFITKGGKGHKKIMLNFVLDIKNRLKVEYVIECNNFLLFMCYML
jgi:hypothetical protein